MNGKLRVIETTHVTRDAQGRIVLSAHTADVSGSVVNTGKLEATAGEASGEIVELHAEPARPSIEIEANQILQEGVVQADGGDISLKATGGDQALLMNTGYIGARSTATQQGHVLLLSNDGHQSASPEASGRYMGGTLRISGGDVWVENAILDVSGRDGGGQLRLGGEYLGGQSLEPLPGLFVPNLLRAVPTRCEPWGA